LREKREISLKYPSRNYPFSIYYISKLYHPETNDGNLNDIVRIVDKENGDMKERYLTLGTRKTNK